MHRRAIFKVIADAGNRRRVWWQGVRDFENLILKFRLFLATGFGSLGLQLFDLFVDVGGLLVPQFLFFLFFSFLVQEIQQLQVLGEA